MIVYVAMHSALSCNMLLVSVIPFSIISVPGFSRRASVASEKIFWGVQGF